MTICIMFYVAIFTFSLIGADPTNTIFDCYNQTDITSPSQLIQVLFNWCTSDQLCNDLYFAQRSQNITVFTFLTRSILFNMTLLSPLQNYICNKTQYEVIQSLWLLTLYGERYLQPICGPNFKPTIQADGITIQCVCEHDKMCTDQANDRILLYLMAALLIFLTVVIVLLNIFRAATDHRRLEISINKSGKNLLHTLL